MNRIIIIGNGFDLAHGLPTSYKNFINWYLEGLAQALKDYSSDTLSDDLCKFKIYKYDWYTFFINNPLLNDTSYKELIKIINDNPQLLSFTSSRFLEAITKCIEKNNWVDIEKEYYDLLSKDFESSDNENITKLNKELECLKNNLIAYLKEVETKLINGSIVKDNIKEKILEPINPRDISVNAKKNIWPNFIKRRFDNNREYLYDLFKNYSNDIKNSISKIINFEKEYEYQIMDMGINSVNDDNLPKELLYPDSILLLNFNYTKTADLYLPKEDIFKVNHIHGKLSNPQSIIFGYGDELDDNYKKLLKDNNNEYLKNIKSINYLNYTNYRELLSYIESAPYQIYIMGHSCGLSDKTLLNTLFEHDNCVSIKPFYYINKDGRDNYTDIVQNISRNFTDMKLMRDRVVNKTFCETLE